MNPVSKRVLSYVFLPQVLPRTQNLLGSGFGTIAFLIAQIFASVRLLPYNHAYLNRANNGRFGIRHVVHEAWRHLKFEWRHIDQIMMFFVILTGLAILVLQIVMLVVGMLTMGSAMALTMPSYFSDMFITPEPENDLAFIMLDRVFGISGLFGSCASKMIPCFQNTQYNLGNVLVDTDFPTPFHVAFHQMLSVYSYGLLAVAAIIIVYFVVSIIGETTQTGTPFGQRFNRIWAPLRLVIALGLLIPIQTSSMASGLNSAQYIVLYAAKFGSGFATNGWNMFLTGASIPGSGQTILGSPDTLVGTPKPPPANSLLSFGSSLAACLKTQKFLYPTRTIKGWLVNPSGIGPAASKIDLDDQPSYQRALTFNNYDDLYFVFGEYDKKHSGYPAFIKPYCGELILELTDVADAYSPGSTMILNAWYNLIVSILWYDVQLDSGVWGSGSLGLIGTNAAKKHIANYPGHNTGIKVAESEDLAKLREGYEHYIKTTLDSGVATQRDPKLWDKLDNFGWASAGLWYNKVAEMNGMLVGAANALPAVRRYPETMEEVLVERQKTDKDGGGLDRFMPRRADDGTEIKFNDVSKNEEAKVLHAAYKVWEDETSDVDATGNIFTDAIMVIFGAEGLYNMAENNNIHPLAQLVGVGKSLVEASIRNMGAAFFAGAAAGIGSVLGMHRKAVNTLDMVSKIAYRIATISLTAGFLLFYIVPFMPFLYFFFAVGTWVKTVLEAMVGVPLWALAHLRIDGDGLPGKDAMGGYFLVFDVFLRPICIIFALLASISIFAAQVKILHHIWPMVTSNLTGFEADPINVPQPGGLGAVMWFRSYMDQFLFTALYVFTVYMMAMASFKLIDMIPDHILRWLSSNVPDSFGGIAKDNDVSGMPIKMVIGIVGGIKQAGDIGGGIKDNMVEMGKDRGKGKKK